MCVRHGDINRENRPGPRATPLATMVHALPVENIAARPGRFYQWGKRRREVTIGRPLPGGRDRMPVEGGKSFWRAIYLRPAPDPCTATALADERLCAASFCRSCQTSHGISGDYAAVPCDMPHDRGCVRRCNRFDHLRRLTSRCRCAGTGSMTRRMSRPRQRHDLPRHRCGAAVVSSLY